MTNHNQLNYPIIIVGGGAGGLELACRLGRKLGRRRVMLVDRNLTHIWKPSLHEVAAGTLDIHQEGLSYSMLARTNDFTFVPGEFTALDTARSQITVAPFAATPGDVILPQRTLHFSKLCIAVGSTSNHYGTVGAAEHTISLNSAGDAERFRVALLKQMTWAEQCKPQDPAAGVDIVIIGGGATGVELAAELREACRVYVNYGFQHLDPLSDIRITLLEGAPRILAPLPERVSDKAAKLLKERHVNVITGCRVATIDAQRVWTQDQKSHPFGVCVWAAGIKAPAFLAELGLPTNRTGQIEVTDRLHVADHPTIFAMGDCAACVTADGRPVPPRAQAAHQQADYLYEVFTGQAGVAPGPFAYRDYGSLVSLGTSAGVGSLMASLTRGAWFVEGFIARMLYMSLHLMHHRSVLGVPRTAGLALARALIRRSTALVKLH